MTRLIGLFLAAAVAIGAGWWWLGRPVPMPASPFAAGEKLQCVSYAPFRGSQNPFDNTVISAEQIDQDLSRLAAVTGCVRTYSVDRGLDQIPQIAERHGLKVMLGLWLSRFPDLNKYQLDKAITLANSFPNTVRSVVVGNEVLLRGELSAAALAVTIRQVKAAVPPSVRVTYADVWEFWLKNRDLAAAVDFVTIHILPYWEDFPIAAPIAAAHVAAIRRQVGQELPGKEVFIGEVGWPSAGRMREGALPSPSAQARVLHDVLAALKRDDAKVNVIEAFDQPWKRKLEGTVGGHWGLFDGESRESKFVWGEPVSDHPQWRWQALAGVILAGCAATSLYRRRDRPAIAPSTLVGLAVIAVAGGLSWGWALDNAIVESLGLTGWIRSFFLIAMAGIAPVLCAFALVRGVSVPALTQVVARRSEQRLDPLALALGAAFAVLMVVAVAEALGLVFDPRYRDFPFAPLTGATVPFLVLALRTTKQGVRPAAEVAAAAMLALSAVYILFNEGVSNWQSVWFCAALVALSFTLQRSRAAPS